MIKQYPKLMNPDPYDLHVLFTEIFRDTPALREGKSVLQIGARPGGGWKKMFDGFGKTGYERFDILEIWQPNVYRLKLAWPMSLGNVICGDVRKIADYRTRKFGRPITNELEGQYDVIVYHHGPEHITRSEFLEVLPELEMMADKAVILGTPNGIWDKKGVFTHDNPHEDHVENWYGEDFEKLGCDVHVFGPPDKGVGTIVAVKVKA